ncbi:methyltransferase domain-containing protein [Noviherbaspirillum cavernae]|uniref:tRNA (guanine(46)-N(7))-methyltransferase n=1 Tax=Noviherbaspirillum cavernae TaxID=2320862 RepID=A0A418X5I5_9BURK|nr:methyltransferase domain-containing protein [Noviherbaspirillum cavernae]RJG07748.1 methyltransferase domain-containing protein [Noviherbaspirillum cavernae]
MHGNSRSITSGQSGIHEHLAALVARHAATEFRKPIADYNRAAFDRSMSAWRAAGELPLILDAGCGVGLSSLNLAAQFPDHFVIGVDQSADRLARNKVWERPLPSNLICVRADLVDYWRLMQADGVRPARHFVLYPNPWPKIGQLARRWHGHAVFPTIVALGGELECRSNWRIYIEEFAMSVSQLTASPVQCEPYAPAAPITPFEQKYLASGHTLWRCRSRLPARAPHLL